MSTRKKLALRIIGGIVGIGVIGFLVIQFVPIRPRTNPPVVQEPNWDSPQTRQLMERACFDCHSNETKWPAYAYVAPVSWMIVDEVNEGRHKLNFSRWGIDENEEADEAVETILENEMPPRQYLLLHPEAQLSDAEVNQLVAGLRATFGTSGEEGEEQGAYRRDDDDQDEGERENEEYENEEGEDD